MVVVVVGVVIVRIVVVWLTKIFIVKAACALVTFCTACVAVCVDDVVELRR